MWTLAQKPAFWPTQPNRIEELGISPGLVTDLVLRYVYRHGMGTLAAISETIKIPVTVVETLFTQLRQQQLVDVRGMKGHDYVFTLTGTGRTMATERSTLCQYTGPAPVSLDQYAAASRVQAARVRV